MVINREARASFSPFHGENNIVPDRYLGCELGLNLGESRYVCSGSEHFYFRFFYV